MNVAVLYVVQTLIFPLLFLFAFLLLCLFDLSFVLLLCLCSVHCFPMDSTDGARKNPRMYIQEGPVKLLVVRPQKSASFPSLSPSPGSLWWCNDSFLCRPQSKGNYKLRIGTCSCSVICCWLLNQLASQGNFTLECISPHSLYRYVHVFNLFFLPPTSISLSFSLSLSLSLSRAHAPSPSFSFSEPTNIGATRWRTGWDLERCGLPIAQRTLLCCYHHKWSWPLSSVGLLA